MKLETKITLILIFILLVSGAVIFIFGFTVFDFLSIPLDKNGLLTLILFLFIGIAILFIIGFFIDRQIRKPLFFFIRWIDQLSNGTFKRPDGIKDFSLNEMKLSSFVELKDKLDRLTHQLNLTEKEQKELDETRRNWTSGVTHDLKTPLSYIKGYAAMLRSEHKWDEQEIKEFAHIIEEKSVYIEHLIDDLSVIYEFDKMQIPLNLQTMDLSPFVKKVLADLDQYPLANHYQIKLNDYSEKVRLTFDQSLLKRALENFIMNAIHHNPQGTTIIVSIKQTTEFTIIEIEDDGTGMDEKMKKHLFNQYYRGTTTDAQHLGSGLGMSIAKQFIEKQGGMIAVESEINEGTKITIKFPA